MTDEFADIRAALAVQARLEAGTEEFVPARIVDRLIDGENPLKVWRNYRGMSQSALARVAGVDCARIADIEAGRAKGSIRTLTLIADALGVDLDDLTLVRTSP